MPFPSLFISHGSPMILLDESPARHALAELATTLPRPKAIIIMTAHWLSVRSIGVTCWQQAALIHDFHGFPAPLYQMTYPAEGAPALADRIIQRLQGAGFDAYAETQRGLDHGSWVPLRLMYPAADIPVIQLSVPHRADTQTLLRLGELLSVFRDNCLLIGSGLLTHNLGLLHAPGGAEHPALQPFLTQLTPLLECVDQAALSNWQHLPGASLFHPTDEHFRPLLFAAGAGHTGRLLHRSIDYGSFAMDMWAFDGEIKNGNCEATTQIG